MQRKTLAPIEASLHTRSSTEAQREGTLARVVRFFSRAVWESDVTTLSPWRRLLYRIARMAYLAARGFHADNCLLRASALTYITVLSLVPLLAFSFSVLKGFGFYDRFIQGTVTPLLDRTFGPAIGPVVAGAAEAGSSEMRQAISHVLEFVDRTDVASLGVLGLVLLVYTVLKLLSAVEHSFNDIWGIQKPRRWIRKLADYLAMVIVTPILLLAATAITTAAQGYSVLAYMKEGLHLDALVNVAVKLVPLVAIWVGFVFVYMAMPNARTRFASALLGAIVGGTLWQITLVLHLKFQIGIARYNAIYSSFAAIPIFLMWVNISWVTVLLGAEVCFAHQSEPSYAQVVREVPEDQAFKEVVGLRAMTRVGERFLRGEAPWTEPSLAASLGIPVRALSGVLAALVDEGLLVMGTRDVDPTLLLARDPQSIRVKTVHDALRGKSGRGSILPSTAFDRPVDAVEDALDEELRRSPSNVTLHALCESAARARRESEARAGESATSPSTVAADGTDASARAQAL